MILYSRPRWPRRDHCSRHAVAMREAPGKPEILSANFLEEQDRARDRLMLHARHSDLIVLGRPAQHLSQQLKWHGILAETQVISNGPHALTHHLARAASDLQADMLVVGGFGHSRLRERANPRRERTKPS